MNGSTGGVLGPRSEGAFHGNHGSFGCLGFQEGKKMKQSRVLALCSLVFLIAVGLRTPVSGASSLKLGTASGSSGDTVNVLLLLSSTQDVQGVVAAFDWDGTKLEGANLTVGAVLATADTVVRR